MRFIVLGMVVALAGLMASERGTAAEGGKSNPQLGKVRHVVLFKFKEGTTAEQQKTGRGRLPRAAQEDPRNRGFRVGHQHQPGEPQPGIHPLLPGHVQRRQRPRRISSPSGPQGVREGAEALSRQGAGDRLRGEGLILCPKPDSDIRNPKEPAMTCRPLLDHPGFFLERVGTPSKLLLGSPGFV